MPSIVIRISSAADRKFASSEACQSDSETSRKSLLGGPPAFVTRMSGCGASAIISSRPRGVATSAATTEGRMPVACSILPAASASTVELRETKVTATPSATSAFAHAKPRPRELPQTRARRPDNPRSFKPPSCRKYTEDLPHPMRCIGGN
jgi:hypothetical protein